MANSDGNSNLWPFSHASWWNKTVIHLTRIGKLQQKPTNCGCFWKFFPLGYTKCSKYLFLLVVFKSSWTGFSYCIHRAQYILPIKMRGQNAGYHYWSHNMNTCCVKGLLKKPDLPAVTSCQHTASRSSRLPRNWHLCILVVGSTHYVPVQQKSLQH